MSDAVAAWRAVCQRIANAEARAGRTDRVQLIAVSKTFDGDAVWPVIEAGQRVFGENRVQEAMGKWPVLRERCADPLELHLIGPLQSNKAKEAVATFDVIDSVDREKIAAALADEMEKQGKSLPVSIQINTGRESQKAGIDPDETANMLQLCRQTYGLNVQGLMCIPPFDEDPADHFTLLRKLADEHNLPVRSMGMSGDYEIAIAHGATHVRVGSAIFGVRAKPT